MMIAVVVVTVAVAMTGEFCLKSETSGLVAVMMMMGHNGMQHDNHTCHHNHYLCHQMFHTIDFISFGTFQSSYK